MTTASSYSNLVQELYVAYFGRPADYYGLQNFEAALAAANAPTDPAALAAAYSTNSAVKSLIDSFGTSAESTALYGSGSTESFVNAIFENLFGRPAAVAGLTFWVNAINSGAVSKGDAALAILAGAESNTTTQGVSDWTLIQNKIAVATNFTTDLGNSSTQIVAYHGSTAAQDARLMLAGVTASTDPTTFNVQTTINNIVAGNNTGTFNLTTGVDTLIGGPGNNVFNAILDNAAGVSAGGQAATLQSFDSITGGTLNNTLNITDFGLSGQMSIPSGASISGITTLNVNSLEALNLDVSGWSTLTTANFLSSTGTDTVTVGDNVALSVVDSSGNVITHGGSTVNVTTDTSHRVYIYGGASTTSVSVTGDGPGGNVIEDANYGSSTANTITSVSLSNGTGLMNIDSNALTTLSIVGDSYETVRVNAAAGTRTLDLTVNNDAIMWVYDETATTVNVTATGTASGSGSSPIWMYFDSATTVSFNDSVALDLNGEFSAAAAKSVVISGAGDFTASTYYVNAAAAINATGSSGVDTIYLASANGGAVTQSFAGGSGQDIIWIGAGQTGTVTGGSNAHNEIVLDNAGTATVTDIAAVTHFSIFGVAGTTQGTFDMSKVSGYNSFDVQGSGGNVSFVNAATGSTIAVDNGNSHVITLQTVDTTGQSDTTTLTLNAATGGTDFAQVTLEDSINVGIGTINLVSNNTGSADTTTLNSLFDNNWVTLNVSGTGYLDIVGNKVDSANLTINNTLAAAHTGSLTIGTLTDNLLSSLTLKGADGITITNLDSTSTGLTLVDNDTAAVSITNLGDTALTSATFTNSVNTTAGTFVVNSSGTLTEAGLATLNLNGNVEVIIGSDAVTGGITVAGGTDNATVAFQSVGATASGKTDSITLGNGTGDTVALGAGVAGSTQTVVLGTGSGDTVSTASAGAVNVTVGSSTAGTDSISADSASSLHVTAGNGTNVISDTAASASISISAGTGANSITLGTGSSGTISFGTHGATVVDTISLGNSAATSNTAYGLEKISGLNNAGVDSLVFSGETAAVASIQHITSAEVAATAGGTGDATLLSAWIAAATGAAGSGVTTAAHSISWFQYQGNTYLVEMTGADTGTLAATDTVVELTGTGYTFAKTTFTGGNGHVNLLG